MQSREYFHVGLILINHQIVGNLSDVSGQTVSSTTGTAVHPHVSDLTLPSNKGEEKKVSYVMRGKQRGQKAKNSSLSHGNRWSCSACSAHI